MDYSQYDVDDWKSFTLANFHAEICKPRDQRKMPIGHEPHSDGIEVYRRWRERNG